MPLALAAFALSGCEEETIGQLSVKGAFDPDSLEFGDVPVGMSKTLTATFHNTGSAAFTIDKLVLSRPFAITGEKMGIEGKSVAVGDSVDFEVTFVAGTVGEASGTLDIASGAFHAVLNLHGNAIEVKAPILAIMPTALDFGVVEINTESRKSITITNTGNAPGQIDRITLQSTGTDVTGVDEYRYDSGLPIVVAEGGSASLTIVFRPGREGPRTDVMNLQVAGQMTSLPLSLSGQGLVPSGEILCTPSSLEFGQVERGQSKSLSVTCSARGGPTRLIGASLPPGEMFYGLPSPPSTVDLQTDQSIDIAVVFRPDGLPATLTSALTVSYTGNRGQATVVVPLSGELIPPPPTATAISVILRWNTNQTDVDLHLVQPAGTPFSFDGSDCFYVNRNPDWGIPGSMADDPFLDVDDVDGFGPENTNLNQTAPGNYTVLVHYFSDHNQGDSTATVEVYVGGNLAGTFMHLLHCDDVWTVGTVNWNGTTGTFNPSNAVQRNSGEGVCF